MQHLGASFNSAFSSALAREERVYFRKKRHNIPHFAAGICRRTLRNHDRLRLDKGGAGTKEEEEARLWQGTGTRQPLV